MKNIERRVAVYNGNVVDLAGFSPSKIGVDFVYVPDALGENHMHWLYNTQKAQTVVQENKNSLNPKVLFEGMILEGLLLEDVAVSYANYINPKFGAFLQKEIDSFKTRLLKLKS